MMPACHAIAVAVPLLCALFAADRLCHNVQMVDLSTNAITLVAGSTTCNSGNCPVEGDSALGDCLNEPRGIEVSRSVEPFSVQRKSLVPAGVCMPAQQGDATHGSLHAACRHPSMQAVLLSMLPDTDAQRGTVPMPAGMGRHFGSLTLPTTRCTVAPRQCQCACVCVRGGCFCRRENPEALRGT